MKKASTTMIEIERYMNDNATNYSKKTTKTDTKENLLVGHFDARVREQ